MSEGTPGGWSIRSFFKSGYIDVSFWELNLGPIEGQYGLLTVK